MKVCLRLAKLVAFAGLAPLVAACGTGGGSSPNPVVTPTPPPQTQQHVVIIVQENRTPDNLFQGLPGADIATSGLNSLGQTIALQPIPLANTYDLEHSHAAFLAMYDDGKMDGANNVPATCGTSCPYANPQYGYVPSSDNAPYIAMAEQFAFADRMFETSQGPSYPAHQFILSGTSEPSVGSDLLVSEETDAPGCGPTGGSLVSVIDPLGNENQKVGSCFEHPTLPDLLDAKGVTWRYYVPSNVDEGAPAVWIAPNSIEHLRLGEDWKKIVAPSTTILTDIASQTLSEVSWVIPTAGESDHASVNDGTGPSWVASVVNAIGNSRYWKDTTIIVVWDDWGGWYDHVAPQILSSYELGFRVPMIVISPYVKAGYVSHVQHEFGSILKFVEEKYDLGSLNYTDARADDLSDFFNTSQTPLPFKTISARYKAAWFMKRPPDPRPVDSDF